MWKKYENDEERIKKCYVSLAVLYDELKDEAEEKEGKKEEVKLVDYEISENEEKIVNFIKDRLPQLSPYLLYLISAYLGKTSSLIVAPISGGKSKILGIMKQSFKDFTLYDTLTENTLKAISGNMNIGIDDFSHFIFEEHSEKLLTPLASIIQKGEWHSDNLNIKANITLYGAMTPLAFTKLIYTPQYVSMLCDRILRTYIIYYKRKPPKIKMLDNEFVSIPEIKIYEGDVKCDVDYSELKDIYGLQISYDRTDNFIIRMLKGHAKLCGKSEVDENDIKFLKLFEPIISLEKIFYGTKEEQSVGLNDYSILFNVFKEGKMGMNTLCGQLKCEEEVIIKSVLTKLIQFGLQPATGKIEVSEQNSFTKKLKNMLTQLNEEV
jgi:hypothetical protein